MQGSGVVTVIGCLQIFAGVMAGLFIKPGSGGTAASVGLLALGALFLVLAYYIRRGHLGCLVTAALLYAGDTAYAVTSGMLSPARSPGTTFVRAVLAGWLVWCVVSSVVDSGAPQSPRASRR